VQDPEVRLLEEVLSGACGIGGIGDDDIVGSLVCCDLKLSLMKTVTFGELSRANM
jgi:hypothetical protein